MKNALGRPAIAAGIVQDALLHAMGRKNVTHVPVGVRGEGQNPGQVGSIQDQGGRGQTRNFSDGCEVAIKEVLDALVDRAEEIRQRPIFFPAQRQKMVHEGLESVGPGNCNPGLVDFPQLQIQISDQLGIGTGSGSRSRGIHGVKWCGWADVRGDSQASAVPARKRSCGIAAVPSEPFPGYLRLAGGLTSPSITVAGPISTWPSFRARL